MEVLRRFNMSECKPVPTPAVDACDESVMREQDCPSTPEEQKEVADLPYLELIGCLWWLAQMTRPDIFVALQQASKWVARPSAKLWRWLIRILKYLAGTAKLGIVYKRQRNVSPLQAFFDAAFADNSDYKSTAGWLTYSHGALIAYDSTTIKRVVSSSTEAECNAMAIVAKENTWHRRLYTELHSIEQLPPTPVFGDNSASIMMLDTGVTRRSRHFAIEWFLVRDRIDDGELKVEWVPTEANLADFFTKKLPRARFTSLRDQIMHADDSAVANCIICADPECDGSLSAQCDVRELNMDAWMGAPEWVRPPETPVFARMARVESDDELVQEEPVHPEELEAVLPDPEPPSGVHAAQSVLNAAAFMASAAALEAHQIPDVAIPPILPDVDDLKVAFPLLPLETVIPVTIVRHKRENAKRNAFEAFGPKMRTFIIAYLRTIHRVMELNPKCWAVVADGRAPFTTRMWLDIYKIWTSRTTNGYFSSPHPGETGIA